MVKDMDNYYDLNAQEFFDGTVNADMSSHHEEFLNLIPKNGTILDAGCGSGRDTLMFKSFGYEVTSMDGSEEMCKLASEYTKQEVLCLQFQEIEFDPIFDGIWALASLLHVPSNEIKMVLNKLKNSLKSNGAMYASFKYGDFEGERNGRYFNDFTEDSAIRLFSEIGFEINKTWISNDARKGREDEKWVNILVTKP